jgi:hypothetical protein
MEGPAEHLEHIEHHEHAAHHPFDKRVAMTMAIVAAGLAAVTLASHRAHNETLQLQIEASLKQNLVTDQWSYYQARNIRRHEYTALAKLAAFTAKDPAQANQAQSAIDDWNKRATEYEQELKKMEKENKDMEEEVKRLINESVHAHHQGNWYDLGELGIELSLVLCSVAVLTKRAPFWFSGIVIGLVGAAVALAGLFFAH